MFPEPFGWVPPKERHQHLFIRIERRLIFFVVRQFSKALFELLLFVVCKFVDPPIFFGYFVVCGLYRPVVIGVFFLRVWVGRKNPSSKGSW